MKVNIIVSMKTKPHILIAFPKLNLFRHTILYLYKYLYMNRCDYKIFSALNVVSK